MLTNVLANLVSKWLYHACLSTVDRYYLHNVAVYDNLIISESLVKWASERGKLDNDVGSTLLLCLFLSLADWKCLKLDSFAAFIILIIY